MLGWCCSCNKLHPTLRRLFHKLFFCFHKNFSKAKEISLPRRDGVCGGSAHRFIVFQTHLAKTFFSKSQIVSIQVRETKDKTCNSFFKAFSHLEVNYTGGMHLIRLGNIKCVIHPTNKLECLFNYLNYDFHMFYYYLLLQ